MKPVSTSVEAGFVLFPAEPDELHLENTMPATMATAVSAIAWSERRNLST